MEGTMKRIKIVLLILTLMLVITSCGSDEEVTATIPELSDITAFNGYTENGSCQTIEKVIDSYDDDINYAKALTADESKVTFDNCDFRGLNAFTKLYILSLEENDGLTVKEAKAAAIDCLDRAGYDGKTEVDKSFKSIDTDDDGNQLEYTDESEIIDAGAILSTNDYFMYVFPTGILAFGDGEISRYLYDGTTPRGEIYCAFEEQCELVESGTLEEMKNKEYELLDGVYSVGEKADIVLDYFEYGVPYKKFQDGLKSEIYKVEVMKIEEKYIYKFYLRRVYEGVPFAYCNFESISKNFDGCSIMEDYKTVYTFSGDWINSYYSAYLEGQYLRPVKEYDNMLSLNSAIEILNKELANEVEIKVSRTELVYTNFDYITDEVYDEEEDYTYKIHHNVYVPCWEFEGKVRSNGKKIRAFVDAISGKVQYYIYHTDDEVNEVSE
jgi:hypothetical protein